MSQNPACVFEQDGNEVQPRSRIRGNCEALIRDCAGMILLIEPVTHEPIPPARLDQFCPSVQCGDHNARQLARSLIGRAFGIAEIKKIIRRGICPAVFKTRRDPLIRT